MRVLRCESTRWCGHCERPPGCHIVAIPGVCCSAVLMLQIAAGEKGAGALHFIAGLCSNSSEAGGGACGSPQGPWRAPDGLLQLDLAESAAAGGGAVAALAAGQLGALGAQLLQQLQRQRAPRALIPAAPAPSQPLLRCLRGRRLTSQRLACRIHVQLLQRARPASTVVQSGVEGWPTAQARCRLGASRSSCSRAGLVTTPPNFGTRAMWQPGALRPRAAGGNGARPLTVEQRKMR